MEQKGFVLCKGTQDEIHIFKMSFESIGETGKEAEAQILANIK